MKILLLSQWYDPEPAELVSGLAEALHAAGHEVTVLPGFPNFPSGKLYPGYRLQWWQKEVIRGVPVIRVPLFPDHSRSAIRRGLNILTFALAAAVLGPWLAPRVDVIHVIHPPLTIALPAWLLSRLRRVPFTYEIQDMWPETLQATGMLRKGMLLELIGRTAKWVYRRAAAIRVISPGFRQNLIAKGVAAEKIRVISNWVDAEAFAPVPPDPQVGEQFGLANRFNVMFTGMIGPAQRLDAVLNAAALLTDLPDVQFVLIGDGNDLQRLQSLAREQGLPNVKFLGRHPQQSMPGFFAWADALLVHLRDDPLFRITIPHKTFVYMAAGKPVLAAVGGDAADVVLQANAGLTCPPDDPRELATAVRRLYAMSPQQRRQLGENARRAACRTYAREPLTAQIAAILEQVVNITSQNTAAQLHKELAA